MIKKNHPKRLAPTKTVLRALFARSGNRCAFPGCTSLLVDDENNFIGQLCHIEAAMPKGQRFNKKQTDEDRRSEGNLLLLCYPHHIKTNDIQKYTVEILVEMKRSHEAQVEAFLFPDEVINAVYNDQLTKLSQAVEVLSDRFEKHDKKQDQKLASIHALLQRVDANTEGATQDHLPELQTVVDFAAEYKPAAALAIIRLIKESKWKTLSDQAKTKTLTNEGLLHFQMQNMEQGARCMIEALSYSTKDENALAYASLSYSLLGNKVKANKLLKKAFKLNPESVNSFNALIQLNAADFHDLRKQIPVEIQEVAEVSYNLALVAQRQGYADESLQLFQAAVDSSKKEAQFAGGLGSAVLETVTHDPFNYVTDQLTHEVKTKILYAIEMIDHAWKSYAGTELEKKNAWLLVNRSIAKRLLKDNSGALEDMIYAARLMPDGHTLKNLTVSYLLMDNLERALQTCEQYIQTNEDPVTGSLLKSDILFRMGRYEECLALLNALEEKNLGKIDRRATWDHTIRCLTKLGRTAEAQLYVESLFKKEPNELGPFVQAAIFHINSGQNEKARQQLTQGYPLINDRTLKAELFEFANLCYSCRLFDKAASVYKRFTDTTILSQSTRQLIQSLYNSRQRKEALDLSLKLEEIHGTDQFISQALSMIYESIDDLASAIAANERYLKLNPDDQVVLLRQAFIFSRQAEREKLAAMLQKISNIDFTLPHDHGYSVAYLYYQSGNLVKSLELAYETRRAHFNIGNAHVKYLGYYTEVKPVVTAPEFITAGTTVKLKDEQGAIVVYTIEDRLDVIAERGELHVANPIAQQLLNKKVGQSMTIKKDILDKSIEFTIIEIQTNHLFAFQQSMEFIRTRFINEPELAVMNFAPGSTVNERMEPMFRALDREESSQQNLNEHYRAGRATIGTISIIRHTNPIRTFYILATDYDLGIRPVWHAHELSQVKDRLAGGCPVVLDVTTIITFTAAQSLFILEKFPNKKVVAQSTFDELSDLLRELHMSSDGHVTIGKHKGKYVRQEITADQAKRNIEHYEKLQAWVKQHCEIRPANETLTMDQKDLLERDKLIGASFHDSMLITHELNGILVSEDSVLRRIASVEHHVPGMHGFLLSFYSRYTGLISLAEHTHFTLQLFGYNFKGIPSDPQTLVEAAKSTSMKLINPLFQALEGLQSHLFDDKLATLIAVGFLHDVYTVPELQTDKKSRIAVVNAVLQSLFKRPVDLSLLSQSLSIRFRLFPKKLQEVAALIEAFLKKEGLI